MEKVKALDGVLYNVFKEHPNTRCISFVQAVKIAQQVYGVSDVTARSYVKNLEGHCSLVGVNNIGFVRKKDE